VRSRRAPDADGSGGFERFGWAPPLLDDEAPTFIKRQCRAPEDHTPSGRLLDGLQDQAASTSAGNHPRFSRTPGRHGSDIGDYLIALGGCGLAVGIVGASSGEAVSSVAEFAHSLLHARWRDVPLHDSGSLSGGVHPSTVGAHVLAEIATSGTHESLDGHTRRYDVPEEAAVRLLYLIQSTQRLGAALSYSGAKADSRMIRVSSMPRRQ
jgi:hypothetical protein